MGYVIKNHLTISVVVVTKNAGNTIKHLFLSLSEQIRQPDEVLIVVDDPDDSTLKTAGFPSSVKVVVNKKGGIGAARNKGLIEAQGDYVVFIDADAFADSGLLKSIEKFFIEKPTVIVQAGPIINVRSYEEIHKIKAKVQSLLERIKNVDFVDFWPTNNLSVKRAIALSTGGFEEDIHYAGEDMLFCNKLKEQNYKIALNPAALIYHIYYAYKGSAIYRQVRNGKGRAEMLMHKSNGTVMLMPIIHIGLVTISIFGIIWANLLFGILALLSLFHRLYRVYIRVKRSQSYTPITIALLEEIPLTYTSYFVSMLWTPVLVIKKLAAK